MLDRRLKHRQLHIMVVLLGLFLLGPLLPGQFENHLFLAAGVVSAWLASEDQRRARHAIVILALPIGLAVAAGSILPLDQVGPLQRPIGMLVLGSTIAFFLLCAAIIVSSLLKAKSVGSNEIAGTVNFYVILGTFWSYIFTLVEWIHPGSFHNVTLSEPDVGARFLYFSFVTLASLGYGDITPKSHFAQNLAVTEVIMGQFYIAIVVAYLLSLFIKQGSGSRAENP